MSLLKVNRSMNLLYYPFRQRLEIGLAKAQKAGLKVYLFEGFRSFRRQEALYARGRMTPGDIVTNAKPGSSWHHYGVAGDLVFDGSSEPGIQWSWAGDYFPQEWDDYRKLRQIMLEVSGLEIGPAGDWPHYQLKVGLDVKIIKSIYDHLGLVGVWNFFDRHFGKEGIK